MCDKKYQCLCGVVMVHTLSASSAVRILCSIVRKRKIRVSSCNILNDVTVIWPWNGITCVLIIRHKCICIFILWLMSLLVYNGYYRFNKAGPPQVQLCILYPYPQLLQPQGVHVCNHVYTCRSECYTRFTLYFTVMFTGFPLFCNDKIP